jgi:hypothetical protein
MYKGWEAGARRELYAIAPDKIAKLRKTIEDRLRKECTHKVVFGESDKCNDCPVEQLKPCKRTYTDIFQYWAKC